MTTASVGVVCSITFGLLGFIIAYFTFQRNKKNDNIEEGQRNGVVASDLGYIKAGIDDLKRDFREMRSEVEDMKVRLARVEESSKQAHHRLDEFKNERKEKNG